MVLTFSAKKESIKNYFPILLFNFLLLFTEKLVHVFTFLLRIEKKKTLKIIAGELSIR